MQYLQPKRSGGKIDFDINNIPEETVVTGYRKFAPSTQDEMRYFVKRGKELISFDITWTPEKCFAFSYEKEGSIFFCDNPLFDL